MSRPGERRRRTAWTAASVILLAGYVAGLVLLALGARSGFPAVYADPANPWPIALQVALGLGAFGAYWWPRRSETRSFSLLVTASLAVSTIALGLASYWGCTNDQTPFWTPLTWSLNLITGGVHGDCGFPLALQTARLFGPLLVLLTALGVLAVLFRNQRDRLSVRFGRRLVVAVGLTSESLGFLRRLAADRQRGTVLTVLTETGDAALVRAVRSFGGRVVTVSAEPDVRALEVLLTAGRRLKINAAYLLTQDTEVNLAWATALRQVASDCDRSSSTLAPRLLVRIDDPWQAEYWRRSHAYRPAPTGVTWICDSLSPYEITSAILVDRLAQGAHDRVALVGTSTLAQAICAEFSHRAREAALVDKQEQPSLADLVLVGPGADQLADLHRLRQARFGNDSAALSVLPGAASPGLLEQALAGSRRPAVVLADATHPPDQGTTLAVTYRPWTVFARSTLSRGVAVDPVLEGLLPFGLTTELPPDWPLDSWERAARVVHELYLRQVSFGSSPAARPWEALDGFLKESNVRLVTTTLGSVEAIGRSWLPADSPGQDGAIGAGLAPEEVLRIAETEHESWRRHLVDNGWRWGPRRDHARRVHPALRPWPDLEDADRARTSANVLGAVETLAALGYRSVRCSAARTDWQRFNRSGDVTAVKSRAPWTWRTSSGSLLQAEAGDWRVTDGDQVWSVADGIFANSYRHVTEDRWRRIGQVQGRPATAGELINSLEGDEVAASGDWVLRGPAGDEWLVSAEHLSAHYQPVAEATDATSPSARVVSAAQPVHQGLAEGPAG